MCNLYSMTRNQEALRRLFRIARDLTGNLPPFPAIYPDGIAPVVRIGPDGARELILMRWGFPPPPNVRTSLVTNIRNPNSAYWRVWLRQEFRCLVPATSFCEWTDSRPKVPHWFTLRRGEPRPLFAFAGVWRPWTGIRGTKAVPAQGEHLLFAFLTTDANEMVRPVHAQAMPVILTEEAWDEWLLEPAERAFLHQRPRPAEDLDICLSGENSDPTPEI